MDRSLSAVKPFELVNTFRGETMSNETKAIDIHNHIFNPHHLPISGIFTQGISGFKISEKWARGLAAFINWLTPTDCGDAKEGPEADRLTLYLEGITAPSQIDYEEYINLVATERPAVVEERDLQEAFKHVNEARVRQGLAAIPIAKSADADPKEIVENLYAFLVEYPEKLALVDEKRTLEELEVLKSRIRGLIKYFLLWVSCEKDIFKDLIKMFGADVALFVHYVMDMEPHYQGECIYGDDPDYSFRSYYPYQTILDRISNQVQSSDGRLIAFVAFSPFRKGSIDIVSNALAKGYAGVKIYPSMGYLPTGNSNLNFNVPESPGGDLVDANMRKMIDYCLKHDIPIFSHCMERGAVERAPGYAIFGDPKHWEAVIKKPGGEKLRLCFAHAGGAYGWLQQDGFDFYNSYAGAIYRLCTSYDNVYCEFGALDELIGQPAQIALFKERLGSLVGDKDSQKHDFGHKIMYGSDWHMNYMHPQFGEYFGTFREMFDDEDSPLHMYRKKFLRENAIAYLNIHGYLDRNRDFLSGEALNHLEKMR